MTYTTKLTLALCLAAALMPSPSSAQSTSRLSVTASVLTDHVLGLGLEYRIAAPVMVLVRAEGLGRAQAVGGGIRVVPFSSESGINAYGIGMAGLIRCRPFLYGRCAEPGSSFSVAGGGGISFDLSSRWSAGIESMYWHSPSYDPAAAESGQDSRLTVGGVFRLKL